MVRNNNTLARRACGMALLALLATCVDPDVPSTNSTDLSGLDPEVAEQYANCAFDLESFDAEAVPIPVLVRCYTKLKWEAIDLLLENQRLMRRFDFFGKKWRVVKRENIALQEQIEETTQKLLAKRARLREERLDYGALLVSLKMEYNELSSRRELHTQFGTEDRTYLTPEEILRENALAQQSNSSQEQDLAMRTAVEAHEEARAEAEKNGENVVTGPTVMRRLLGFEVHELGESPVVVNYNYDNMPPGTMLPVYQEEYVNATHNATVAEVDSAVATAEWEEAAQRIEALKLAMQSNKSQEEAAVQKAQEAAQETLTALNAANSQLAAAEEAAEVLEAEASAAQGACQAATDQLASNPTDESLSQAKASACDKFAELQHSVAVKAEAVAALQVQAQAAEAKNAEASTFVKNMESEQNKEVESAGAQAAAAQAEKSQTELHEAQQKLQASQQAQAQLTQESKNAEEACKSAEEALDGDSGDEALIAAKTAACERSVGLMQQLSHAQEETESLQDSVQRKVAQSEADAAVAANTAAQEQAKLEEVKAQVDSASATAQATQEKLDELKTQEASLNSAVEQAKAAFELANTGDCQTEQCAADLEVKRQALADVQAQHVQLVEDRASEEKKLSEAEAVLSGAQAEQSKALEQLISSSESESVQAEALERSAAAAQEASTEVAAQEATSKEAEAQVQGAQAEMDSAERDNQERASQNSQAALDAAIAEYQRATKVAEREKPRLVDAQERKAKQLVALEEAQKSAALATQLRQRLQQALPKKRAKGQEPGMAAEMKEKAEALATEAAVAKAKAKALAAEAAASQARAAESAAEAEAFKKAQAQAQAEAEAEKARRKASMALHDPSKMNPIILQAKMNSLVREHASLNETNTMLHARDKEIEQQYLDEQAKYDGSMKKYTGLVSSFDEVCLNLKMEIRKTTALKPAIGGEGVCTTCPVDLPDHPEMLL